MPMVEDDRPARSVRKARGSGHLRRAELLAAAQRIFLEEGYEGATIRKIADEVGVSSTAIYMYFQDKSQIMLEICVQALEGLYHEMDAVSALHPQPIHRLRALLEAILRFGAEQPTAYQLLYCVAPKEVHLRRFEVTAPLSRQCFQRIQSTVQEAIAAGQLRSNAAPRTVTEAMIAACHGVLSMRMGNPNAPWTEPEVMARTLLDGLFQGFATV